MGLVTRSTLSTLDPARFLSDDERRNIISYYEQQYWETGQLPTIDKVASTFNLRYKVVVDLFNSEKFQTALTKRGIKDLKLSNDVLSPEQIIVANMILNLQDRQSVTQKLELLGISTSQYAAWRRDPAFQKYLQDRAKLLFESASPEAYTALLRNMLNGDMRAVQMYMEMVGLYNPKIQVQIDVKATITNVVEIIARHVKDPAVIEAVAKEIECLEM